MVMLENSIHYIINLLCCLLLYIVEENSRPDFACSGTSARTENSLPPLFNNSIEEDDLDNDEFRPIDEKDVLSYARQIAMGMVSKTIQSIINIVLFRPKIKFA